MKFRTLPSVVFAFAALTITTGAATAASGEMEPRTPQFIASSACTECHAEANEAWTDSHHGWALREPTPRNMLGDFNDAVFEHKGVVSKFFRKNEAYFVETDDADGNLNTFRIAYAVGVAPLQQYLIALDNGALQTLDIAWDDVGERWFHVFPDLIPTDGGLHWTGPYKNWQARCAECHQTNFEKGYAPSTRTYNSRWSELTVGCETCHGPGQAHVAWAKDPEGFDPRPFAGIDSQGLTVAFDDKTPESEIQVCAPCHSRREPLGANSPPPGEAFADHYVLSLLRDGLYHADGQIDDEVYVYGSFLQSKMYDKGVRCTNCHDPHSGRLLTDGDGICEQCHSSAGNQAFPTLALTDYTATEHHRHEIGTEAAQCVSCHMPQKNYMVIDGRRDHSFRVPRPDLSVKLGTPDACTGCHEDKDLKWAAEQVEQWYPGGRTGQPHFAETLARAHRRDASAKTRDDLISVALDGELPAIVRATALDLSQPATELNVIERITPLLRDPSDLVRRETIRLFRGAPPALRVRSIGPLLTDPYRSVRVTAARELLDIPSNRLDQQDRAALAAAAGEYQRSLLAKADYPEIQMRMAGLAMGMRNLSAAKGALRTAATLDPQLPEAWITLSRVQMAEGDIAGARRTLEEGITNVPQAGRLHHALGGILAQQGDLQRAQASFAKASRLMPLDAGVLVELASVLTRLGNHDRAVGVIERARGVAPNDPDVMTLWAVNHLERGMILEAREITEDLARRHPQYRLPPRLRALLSLPGARNPG